MTTPMQSPYGYKMPVTYTNKTPHARCVLKIQDWLARHMAVISQECRDNIAAAVVAEISDDIKSTEDVKMKNALIDIFSSAEDMQEIAKDALNDPDLDIKAPDPDHVVH